MVAEDEVVWRHLDEVLVIWDGGRLGRKPGNARPQPCKTAASATGVANRTFEVWEALCHKTVLTTDSCRSKKGQSLD